MKGQPGHAPMWRLSSRPASQLYWPEGSWGLWGGLRAGRGPRGCLARPWPPRPAAAACPALPPPSGRGSRACVGRFFTQQGLPGQLLAHWRLARSLNAQPGARPPAHVVCGMSGGMSSSGLSGQTPCVSSGSSLCRAPAGSAAGVQCQRGSLAARIASPTPPGIVPGSGAFNTAASARSSRADSCPCVADALQNAVVHVADCRDARAPRGRVYADGTGVSSGPRGRLLGGGPARPAQRRRAGQPAW